MNQKKQPTETEVAAINQLHNLLSAIPSLTVRRPLPATRGEGEMFPMDGFLQVHSGNKTIWLFVFVKNNAQLRDARITIEYLRRTGLALHSPYYAVFCTQFLSPEIKKLCKDQGIGYLDFSGNYHLAFDTVFLERETIYSKKPERKQLKSLFSSKACRVMRRLLDAPGVEWKVQALADSAKVSAATVSLLKEKLLGEEIVGRSGEAIVLRNPEKLLTEWVSNYKVAEHEQYEFFSKDQMEDFEIKFATLCKLLSINYAFTSFSGARRVAPFVRGIQKTYAYITEYDPLELAKQLDLKLVSTGGNIRFIVPKDNDVLFGSQSTSTGNVVSDIQLYLDLSAQPGRGEENAEFLLEQRIRTKW